MHAVRILLPELNGAGLEAVTHFGPVAPVQPQAIPAPATPTDAEPVTHRLVTCDYFLFDEVRPRGDWTVGGDTTCHFLAVLSGELRLDPRWQLPPLTKGMCMLLPASIGRQVLAATAATTLLHIQLP